MKKIHRSASNRYLAGVVGGLARYFDWNTTLARVIFVILALMPVFPGILVYLILWMVMGDPD
ncbi:PspC domain-containing protein [Levilactobacillus suantsaii]|uniref:PspC domain-containing protein n=1 Tax=Levilactobacillus suantsaii TaxID=2292255 RepID=A0A4Q0VM52_9LACO|nr:PspC domain-containing protein [Levilactobacillus suantsaii]QMU07504.1 PspC domain-containing protein [Levilactobacillus suantsaii]RXI79671.1 PspC domain-containing protein [Levilactobacillus suantsaii]